jgi:alginate O-acetyltransferase complex protein AlgI
VTFLLGGLWHGAAWTFVCWGALHGLGLCVLRLWTRAGFRLPRVVAWATTFLFLVITWVFFRANSIPDALAMLKAMIGLSAIHVSMADIADALKRTYPGALLSLAIGVAIVFQRRNSNVLVREMSCSRVFAAWTAGAFVISVLQLGNVTPFLYFNF